MVDKIAIVSDSTSDYTSEQVKKYNFHVVEAYVHFGSETFTSAHLSMKEFHQKIANSTKENFPKKSSVTLEITKE